MNFELDWKSIGVGAIIAAVIIKIGDYLLLSSRSAVDRELLEKRFQFDMDLAKQKFDYEVKKDILTKKQQLAEEVLALAYDLKDTINIIRTPFQFENEACGENEKGRTMKDAYRSNLQRYETRKDKIGDFFSRKHRMKALFGDSSDEAFNIFNAQLGNVVQSLRILLNSNLRDLGRENLIKHEENIWIGMAEEDHITKEINRAIEVLENVCRPILSERPDA